MQKFYFLGINFDSLKNRKTAHREQTDGHRGEVGGWAAQVMGMMEGTCDEPQVTYGSAESWVVHLNPVRHCM